MQKLFELFEERFNKLRIIQEANFSRKLKVFNFRFRLALDIVVDYKNDSLSYVKTKEVKTTYILLVKLMELWNSYEALVKYAQSDGCGYTVPTKITEKNKLSVENFFTKTKALLLLKELAQIIRKQAEIKERFKKDFDVYTKRIDNCNVVEDEQKALVKKLRAYVFEGKEITGIEILSLIYIERNMYYHNGETAKLGMSYSNRIFLLSNYLDYLTRMILLNVSYIINEQIKKLKTGFKEVMPVDMK